MWQMHDGMFWGMHFMWWIFFILLVLLLLFMFPNKITNQRSGSESALDILKKRFASGEISKEEYEERRQIIEQH